LICLLSAMPERPYGSSWIIISSLDLLHENNRRFNCILIKDMRCSVNTYFPKMTTRRNHDPRQAINDIPGKAENI
jgi:hypothetical protein